MPWRPAWGFRTCTRRIPSARGSATTWTATRLTSTGNTTSRDGSGDERAIYDRADAIIATTPQQRDILLDGEYEVEAGKIAVIPPGYDDARYFPVSAATRQAIKHDLGVDGRLVLALGRVAANKGYDLLLRAMPTVFERLPDARLMLAIGSTSPTPGEARQVEELRLLAAELGIADRMLFHDYVPDEMLADYLSRGGRLRPQQPVRAVRHDCRRGDGLRDTRGGDDRRRAVGDGGLGNRGPLRGPAGPTGLRARDLTVLRYPRIARQLARFGSHRARATFHLERDRPAAHERAPGCR